MLVQLPSLKPSPSTNNNRCMKFLLGYMILATTVLLGFLGSQMFTVAINKYQLPIDKLSFYLTMYNFAIVGTLAVFYQKGVPTIVNQGYLVANSTIVAWQLSYFNDWMAWALLIMLALYDLFAVLTPCGPLKALVNLMSKEDAPAMPGLLYEAELPVNAVRPGRGRRRSDGDRGVGANEYAAGGDENGGTRDSGVAESTRECVAMYAVNAEVAATDAPPTVSPPTTAKTSSAKTKSRKKRHNTQQSTTSSNNEDEMTQSDNQEQPVIQSTSASLLHVPDSPTSTLPLAIAKVYKLPLALPQTPDTATSIDYSHPKAYVTQQFTTQELQMNVQVAFPIGGGRIETTLNRKGEARYVVYDRHGNTKRTLLVDKHGKVMEEVPKECEDDEKGGNTIKLGLGDFIFYSVLVSRAAENGFAAFVACFLSILTGLGGTLVLLAVYHHALPALPISIFLAVVFFVLTIYCMEPWIQDMWQVPYYF